MENRNIEFYKGNTLCIFVRENITISKNKENFIFLDYEGKSPSDISIELPFTFRASNNCKMFENIIYMDPGENYKSLVNFLMVFVKDGGNLFYNGTKNIAKFIKNGFTFVKILEPSYLKENGIDAKTNGAPWVLFKNKMYSGLWEDTNKKGDKRLYHFENGNLEGEYEQFFGETLIVQTKGKYNLGKKIGKWVTFFNLVPNKISVEVNYVDGMKNGQCKTWYPDGTTLKILENYENNKKIGAEEYFFSNGKLQKVTLYDKGVEYGTMIEYDKQGNIKNPGRFTLRKNGKIDIFYSDGITLMQTLNVKNLQTGDDPSDLFKRPCIFSKRTFFSNGALETSRNFLWCKILEGKYESFYPNSKPYASGFFREGVFDATHKIFDASSEIKLFYENGMLMTFIYKNLMDKKKNIITTYKDENSAYISGLISSFAVFDDRKRVRLVSDGYYTSGGFVGTCNIVNKQRSNNLLAEYKLNEDVTEKLFLVPEFSDDYIPRKNRIVKAKMMYLEGKLHGDFIINHNTGTLHVKGTFSKGLLNRNLSVYNEKGKKIKEFFYKEGKLQK